MPEKTLISLVKKYNQLMREAIKGPNCVDPSVCLGDCCSIRIDVPKELAQEYIRRKFASEDDFIRSNVFTFQLRFDDQKRKCFLFNNSINGCSVHFSGIKPPQCWIYPTGFSNKEESPAKCKKAGGWVIINDEKALKAKILLDKYTTLCQIEAIEEKELISERIHQDSLVKLIKKISPSQLGGFKDMWGEIRPLSADGLSLQMKKLCFKQKPSCEFLKNNFLECKYICEQVARFLISVLKKKIVDFVRIEGPDVDGNYPLYKLTKDLDF